MPFPPSRRRVRQALRTMAGGVCVVAACAAAALGSPGPAHADSIAAKRAEAQQVEAHLNALNAQMDAAVEAYDRATSKLHGVQAQVRRNTVLLGIARHNLTVARRQLASLLVAGYKATGTNDPSVYVLGASSFMDLVNRIDFVQRTNAEQTTILAQVQTAEKQVAAHQAALKRDEKRAKKLVAQANARKHQVTQLQAHYQAVLGSIKSDIARMIQQQQQRQAALARQRAEAAARRAAEQQAQQAAPPPSTGTGSGGSPGTGGSGGGSPSPPPSGTLGQQAVQIAEGELGVPYVWGGASPAGFDCSGLTMWVYAQLGVHLDHYTGSQWNAGPHVPFSDLQPGDLVFFEPGIGHVGIYIGNNLFIHAPHTGTVVQISSITGWYAAEYQGAVRVTG